MIEFVLAPAAILADWGSWIILGLLAWLLAGISIAIPVARRLAEPPDQQLEDEERVL